MIAIDSDSLINIFKDDEKLNELLKSLEDDFCSTIINYQELIFGLNWRNSREFEEEDYYDNLFNNIILFNLDKKSCKKSREIMFDLKKIGKTIGEFDCMIAGILLSNGVNKLITRNVKHFENIPGLKVISY